MRKAPLPKAPIIRTTKHIKADGTITVRKSIKNSALNKIRLQSARSSAATPSISPQSGSGVVGTDTRGLMHPTNPASVVSRAGKSSKPVAPTPPAPSIVLPHITSSAGKLSSGGTSGRVAKHTAKDGTINLRVKMPASEFYKTQLQQEQPKPAFAPRQPRRGWPEAAIRDWAAWGSKNPALFFAIWKELSGSGGGLEL